MKQIYYVIRTLLRGHGSNVIKILSLALGLTMSILLFARVAFTNASKIMITCIRSSPSFPPMAKPLSRRK